MIEEIYQELTKFKISPFDKEIIKKRISFLKKKVKNDPWGLVKAHRPGFVNAFRFKNGSKKTKATPHLVLFAFTLRSGSLGSIADSLWGRRLLAWFLNFLSRILFETRLYP